MLMGQNYAILCWIFNFGNKRNMRKINLEIQYCRSNIISYYMQIFLKK